MAARFLLQYTVRIVVYWKMLCNKECVANDILSSVEVAVVIVVIVVVALVLVSVSVLMLLPSCLLFIHCYSNIILPFSLLSLS